MLDQYFVVTNYAHILLPTEMVGPSRFQVLFYQVANDSKHKLDNILMFNLTKIINPYLAITAWFIVPTVVFPVVVFLLTMKMMDGLSVTQDVLMRSTMPLTMRNMYQSKLPWVFNKILSMADDISFPIQCSYYSFYKCILILKHHLLCIQYFNLAYSQQWIYPIIRNI